MPRKLAIIQPQGGTVSAQTTPFDAPPARARLPFPYRPEADGVSASLARLGGLDWPAVIGVARPWVDGVRAHPAPFWAMESLLHEYPISTAEGLALMRLAEALLRVPDAETAIALTADQLGRADFDATDAEGPHRMLASLSASAIALSKRFLPESESPAGLLKRLGAKTVVAATVRALQLLGRQFVLGRTIGEAMGEASGQRKSMPNLRFSYDMLGEGARTERDAQRYLASYRHAIDAIAAGRTAASPHAADGISMKLSALFPRYEDAQRERVFAELLPRVWSLIEPAARANINLTIDAEESDRLELSLDVMEALAGRIATVFPQWHGFGLAVQSYLTNGLAVVDEVAAMARRHGLKFMVRLVKGAYWDGEIKRAQEAGLPGYPVFTHKQHTDISYLACARALIGHHALIYPQFATHNAGTIAAILQMARAQGAEFEFQRLHGMSEGIYREVSRQIPTGELTATPPAPPAQAGGLNAVPVRVYAPVGLHRDLLAYLVRRLLENGANSSFVHQLADEAVSAEELLASPLQARDGGGLPLPAALYRRGARQFDRRRSELRGDARAARAGAGVGAPRAFDDGHRGRDRSGDAPPARRLSRLERAPARRACGAAAARRRCARCPPARVLRAAGQGSAQDPGRLRGRGARGGRLLPLLRRTGRSCTRPGRRRPAAACSSASARGTSRWRSLPARWSPRWWPATPWRPSPPSRRRWWRAASSPCCTRSACRPTRCSGCTAAARPSAPRWWPMRERPACASPAARRWRASSTARWPPRPARSCR